MQSTCTVLLSAITLSLQTAVPGQFRPRTKARFYPSRSSITGDRLRSSAVGFPRGQAMEKVNRKLNMLALAQTAISEMPVLRGVGEMCRHQIAHYFGIHFS